MASTTITMFAHLQIPLEDVVNATNNFHQDNIIGHGGFGPAYKGQLLSSGKVVKISALRLDRKNGMGVIEFWKQISLLSNLEHTNLVSLIGFCDEKDEKIIITTYEPRGSLLEHLNKPYLTWMQRLRICVGVAHVLSYLHNYEGRGYGIIHRNINSSTILLDENWEAKLFGFEISIKQSVYRKDRIHLCEPIGKIGYMDPTIKKIRGVTYKSDIYSLGVILFEVLCGRKAFIRGETNKFLAPLAKYHYENGTLKDIIHPDLWNQMSPQSLFKYSEVAYRCLQEELAHRPDANNIVDGLEKTLEFQLQYENHEGYETREPMLKVDYKEITAISKNSQTNISRELQNNADSMLSDEMPPSKMETNEKNYAIPLEDIKVATQNFHDNNCIATGGYVKVYKGNLQDGDGFKAVVAKRLARSSGKGDQRFLNEVQILLEYKHENIVGFVGYCDEKNENILVYEHASRGSVYRYLDDASLTWIKRLNICIDVASALHFLHEGVTEQAKVIHRDIKSANILVYNDWKAKLTDFGFSLISPINQEIDYVIDHACGTKGYMDPLYQNSGFLTIKSDIYSFGVVLFEILCGRSTFAVRKHTGHYLPYFIKKSFEEGKLDKVVFKQIKEQIVPESLSTFQMIAYQCLHLEKEKRPTTKEVLMKLKKALDFQIHRELAHLAIRLEDIVSATNNFANKNLVKEGVFGKYYKGQMLQSGHLIDIYARRLDSKFGQKGVEFKTEISVLSSLKHKNIISVVGFCDEDHEKIIVYEHAGHGCLDQHLSGPNLTWLHRLKICLGVASALSHIHYDVIHCHIDSSKIFLDNDWEPKIFGFELSTKYPQSWRHRLQFSRHFDNTNMTPKYDVYCFGVLLFEVVCGRKPMIGDHGVKEEMSKIIDPNLRKQMNTQSLDVFTKITYNCLNQQLVQCPTMDKIFKELEDVLELQWKHENARHSTATSVDEGTTSNGFKLEWLKIPLKEIRDATHNFDEQHFVGAGGFGTVYKAELHVLDIQNLSSMEGKCKDEPPKRRRRRTVAIKHIINRPDDGGKEGFLAEIELLTSCMHQNIVSLLGFCEEGGNMILVYEYAFKGSLNDYFGNTSKMMNLNWAQRIQICLDVANGINYLHTNTDGKPRIIHRDIKSDNILLDENLNAKIADFGLSKFHFTNKQSTIYTKRIAGTDIYMDPEYLTTSKYKKESDIYSFGVVLFEILTGRPAYDSIYMGENAKGLAPIARRRFNEGTIKELLDPKITEEDDKNIFTLNRGPNQESFNVFTKIAYQCLAETQAKRPTMEAVINELENALKLQGETMILTRFQLSEILFATEEFSEIYRIGLHECGTVYRAELDDFEDKSALAFEEEKKTKTRIPVAIKCISGGKDAKESFYSEIEMHASYKHPNIVSLLGFCDEGEDVILVYEHPFNKSLDDYLQNANNMDNLTWTQRLQMCIGIARGLIHLHTKMGSQERMIHGDIRSANILLGKNLEPKIAYFGIFEFHLATEEASTKVYWDPEFEKTRIMKKESDIFSFGVILFEIFSGMLAYDRIYIDRDDKGLIPIVRNHFKVGAIKTLLDPKLKEVRDDETFTSSTGPDQDSLDKFLKIAYQCLEEAPANRPTMETVIKELEIALDFQENRMKSLRISLKDIETATKNFSQENWFGRGRYWEAYKGEMPLAKSNANTNTTIFVKRLNSKFDDQFRTELDILLNHKHENIIGLLGYCIDMSEKIIVYEHLSKGSLDKHLKDSNLRWMERLQICIDVASALEFLHGGDATLKKVIHRDIRSHGILLNDDWKAKISNFELSMLDSLHQDMEHLSDDGYLDPEYKQGFLTEKSDIYSFGVVLFEILCGRLARAEGCEDNSCLLGPLAKHYYEQGKLDEIVFEDVKKQSVPQSLTTFADIAYQCLEDKGYKRPQARVVAIQLKKALKFQEEFEIWEPKLPRHYKEIMLLLGTHETYEKKDIYDKFSKGILLPKEKVWFILSHNGQVNKMISATATKFSYSNRQSHKCRSIQISRFQKVAKMLDISNLQIQITVDNQFLSPDVIYGVYLVFKICDPRSIFSLKERLYVNLKYRNGTETLHSYFATWRDDEWMMIELYRFLNKNEKVSFKFLLDSFSRYYCTSGVIYIEGIEFRAIKKVAHDEDLHSDLDELKTISKESFVRGIKSKRKFLTLSATEVLYNPPNMKPFRVISSAESRFRKVVELPPQQVVRIKCKIETQMLSPFTEYTCYLVFKLSEKCQGLHCPVKVREPLLNMKNKENKIIYFRSPARLNQHDAFGVPEQGKDGWMEVMIWKFNSKFDNKVGKDYIPMNLKLITYEGTMSGLIIYGLNFRPM